MKINRNIIDPFVFFLVLGLLWEFSVELFDVRAYLLPSLTDIFRETWEFRELLLEQAMVTLEEVLFGFIFAAVFGVVISAAIFFIPIARRTIYPLIIGLQSIPKVALAPIIVVWFGYGLPSKVVMAFLFAFFPIVISTLGGLSATPDRLVEHFQALKTSGWNTFWKLRAPSALPNFVDGCKVAMPLAVIGAVVGEFVGSNDGLGNLIQTATGSAQTALMFSALLVVTGLSLILFFMIELLGRLVWWRAM